MKTYRGWMESGECKVWVIPGDGSDAYWLPPRPDLLPRGHAMSFRWGVADQRTRSLAAALLCDLTGEANKANIPAMLPAWVRFLSCLPDEGFEVTEPFLIALIYALSPQPREPLLRPIRGIFGHHPPAAGEQHA